MSEPNDTPAERQKRWERRDDQPVDPPSGESAVADSVQSPGGVSAPSPNEIGNFEIQDVFDAPEQAGGVEQPTRDLNYEKIEWTVRDGGDGRDLTDRPASRFEEIKVTARDEMRPLDDVVGVREDSGEAHLADTADEAPGVVMSGGTTMLDASTPKRAEIYDASSPYVHDTPASEPSMTEEPVDEAWEIMSFESTAPTEDPGELTAHIDGVADQPDEDGYDTITLENVTDGSDDLIDG